MNSSNITIALDDQGIAELHMHDESGKNYLTHKFVDEIIQAVSSLSDDARVKVVILRGHDSVFCAGASREVLVQLAKDTVKPSDIVLPRYLLNIPVPLVSAMQGHAVGGGLALGCCADIALISAQSRYGCSFMNMGFTPGMGTTRLLEHFMTPSTAHELLYTGANVKGHYLSHNTGFKVIEQSTDLPGEAHRIASSIAEKPRESLTVLKRTLSLQRRCAFEAALNSEIQMHQITFNSDNILAEIEAGYVK